MTVWILAVILLASLCIVGYYQGAVRGAISLIGLLVAAGLALPVGSLVKYVLPVLGVDHPVTLDFVAPFIAFLIVLIIVKAVGVAVQKKIDTLYKYHASDTNRMLFERLNQRLGISMGVANSTVYLLLICMAGYVLGYFTFQMATSPEESFMVKVANRFAKDIDATEMDKAVAPLVPATDRYFDSVDVLATILHNPIAQSRLSSYPPLLPLAEREKFQQIASDSNFQEFWLKGPSFTAFRQHERIRPLIDDLALYKEVTALLKDDLNDLELYIETGRSEKYDERILARWTIDTGASLLRARRRPNVTMAYLRGVQAKLTTALSEARLLAMVDNRVTLKTASSAMEGTWSKTSSGRYRLTLSDGAKTIEADARVEGNRLILDWEDIPVVFEK